jgi:hypothetical protein
MTYHLCKVRKKLLFRSRLTLYAFFHRRIVHRLLVKGRAA